MASKINKGEILAKFFDDGEYTALFADGAVSAACGYAAGQQAYAVYQNGEAVTVKDVEKNIKVLEMAAQTGCPVVTFYNSVGAKLAEGLDVLTANAKLNAQIAKVSGVIPQVAASARSAGKTYREAVGERWAFSWEIPEKVAGMTVVDAADIDEVSKHVDFVFCAVDMKKDEIRALEEAYAKHEIPVVSNNSACRGIEDVPMVVPEINADHLAVIEAQKKRLGTKNGFIAVKPNCSIQSYVPALTPLLDFEPEKVSVCTYQAISGAGKTFKTWPEMVDNVIPYIGGEDEMYSSVPQTMCMLHALRNLPSAMAWSATWVRLDRMVRISTPSIWPRTAMGMASASAVSAEASVRMAKAAQMMAAMFMSGGAAAPMFTMPRLISSMDAPRVSPVCRSPSSAPTMVQVISGRSKFMRPRMRESRIQNTPTRPRSSAVTNMGQFLLLISLRSDVIDGYYLKGGGLLAVDLNAHIQQLLGVGLLLRGQEYRLVKGHGAWLFCDASRRGC